MIWKAAVIIALMLSILEAKPTWHKVAVNPPVPFGGVTFVDHENGWACAWNHYYDSSRIFHTTNGGRNWTWQYARMYVDLVDIDFCDTLNGWAVGWVGLQYFQCLTSDGGLTWRTRPFYDDNERMNIDIARWRSCRLLGPNVGWCAGFEWSSASGSSGTIAHWRSVLQYWRQGDYFYDIDAVDSSNAWATGDYSNRALVARTNDGGRTWDRQIIDSVSTIYAIDFLNLYFGMAVASDGSILRTTNGGANWTKQAESIVPSRVSLVDTLQGWIVGARGAILHTTDGGNTWFHDSSGTTVNLSGVSFVDSTHGWAVGDSGVVLIYCDSLTAIEENHPVQPNPQSISIRSLSNPTRRPVFTYGLPPGSSQATITIYDCLGEVVIERRLNMPDRAGLFAWDRRDRAGQRVPAGVYFVRLKSGTSSHTSKVLLL